MTTREIYIYGIVPHFDGSDYLDLLKNTGVYAITFKNIAAIVSEKEIAPLDFSDRKSLAHMLVHHQKTIEDLMGKGFNMIIPMKFGTTAHSKEEVLSILIRGYDLIVGTLNDIEFLTEIDLAVTWADFSSTLKEIANHPGIIELKHQLLERESSFTEVDQIKVGMLLKEKLVEKNKMVELRILEAISSISLNVKIHEAMNDQMITNSAFLLNRNKREEFEQIIDRLDEEYSGLLNFKLVGPLPCYSFYTIEVKELNLELVEQAKNELGLSKEPSENEIKRAYLEKARLFHPDTCKAIDSEVRFNKISRAYHTLLDYSVAEKQSSKEGSTSQPQEKVAKNMILVKITE